jgi:hypothetical protein
VNIGPEPDTLDDTLDPHLNSDTVLHKSILSRLDKISAGGWHWLSSRRQLSATTGDGIDGRYGWLRAGLPDHVAAQYGRLGIRTHNAR